MRKLFLGVIVLVCCMAQAQIPNVAAQNFPYQLYRFGNAVDVVGSFRANNILFTDTAALFATYRNALATVNANAISSNGNTVASTLRLGTNNNRHLSFITNGVERMRIDSVSGLISFNNFARFTAPRLLVGGNNPIQSLFDFRDSNNTYLGSIRVVNNGGYHNTGVAFFDNNNTNTLEIRQSSVISSGALTASNITTQMLQSSAMSQGQSLAMTLYTVQQTASNNSPQSAYNNFLINSYIDRSAFAADNHLFRIVPQYIFSGTFSGDIYGFDYNPTLTNLNGRKHYAFRARSGYITVGGTSTNTFEILNTTTAPSNTTTPTAWVLVRVNGVDMKMPCYE